MKEQIKKEKQELMPEIKEQSVESLIIRAIDKGVAVETMEKLLAMRKELKEEFAKQEYIKAMAAFQSECPIIEKTKQVKTRSGIVAYRYAPIESIVNQVKSLLQKHGFSYSTDMELVNSGQGVKAKCIVTHSNGHKETSTMEVPLGTKTDIMSATQVVAAAQTFAKRYAFCNAFGIMTGDEDTDAVPMTGDEKHYKLKKNGVEDAKVIDIEGKKFDVFDPTKEAMEFGKKHSGELWARVPTDYLQWMSKECKDAELKQKAQSTLNWMDMNQAQQAQEPSVVDEMFPTEKEKEQEGTSLFSTLCTEIDQIALMRSIDDLNHWGVKRKNDIQSLPKQQSDILRKAYKNAVKLAKQEVAQ